jgi:hypothetical protein
METIFISDSEVDAFALRYAQMSDDFRMYCRFEHFVVANLSGRDIENRLRLDRIDVPSNPECRESHIIWLQTQMAQDVEAIR